MREMSGGRVVHFRGSSPFQKALMGFLPGRERRRCLRPMNDGCFIAPSEELGHNVTVSALGAKDIHGRVVFPDRHGPESVLGLAHDAAAKKTRGALGLAAGLHSVPEELRKKEKGSDAQTCD